MSGVAISLLDAGKRFEDWFHTLNSAAQGFIAGAFIIACIVLTGYIETH